MFFWHALYGYCGSLNDINIQDLCLFHEYLVDGSFYSIEEQYGIIPFQLDGEGFNKMFILVDRIYPPYFRFVKAVKDPLNHEDNFFTLVGNDSLMML